MTQRHVTACFECRLARKENILKYFSIVYFPRFNCALSQALRPFMKRKSKANCDWLLDISVRGSLSGRFLANKLTVKASEFDLYLVPI